MNIDFDMATMLADSAARYTSDNYHFLARHAILAQPGGYSKAAWNDYAGFGWLALRLPQQAGGLDADIVAVGALMETVGARLLMEPMLASAIVGTELLCRLGSSAQCDALLPRVADGSLKLAFIHAAPGGGAALAQVADGKLSGSYEGVLQADLADLWLVAAASGDGGTQVVLVDPRAQGVAMAAYRMVDDRRAANVRFDDVSAEPLAGDAGEAIAYVLDLASVAQCAEALGIVKMLNSATLDYLKLRKQFGKPIGSNQALQHRAADTYFLELEIAALARHAQMAMGLPAAERAAQVSAARAYIVNAARKVANEAVQMHGGVGLTDELDISHYFRRLMVNAALFGNRAMHFDRYMGA